MAGLERLGRTEEVSQVLDPADMLPAPGQGVITVECRAEDKAAAQALAPLNHSPTARAAAAERSFLAALGGGCNVPLGAYAEADGTELRLTAVVARPDGSSLVGVSAAAASQRISGVPLPRDAVARRGRAVALVSTPPSQLPLSGRRILVTVGWSSQG
jgi:hydroxymethylbilane synthase